MVNQLLQIWKVNECNSGQSTVSQLNTNHKQLVSQNVNKNSKKIIEKQNTFRVSKIY